MSYPSIDEVQKLLTQYVFSYAQDSKKAAGRALGTFIEIITFYLLKTWGLSQALGIEKRLPEYGNQAITHNVEYSLHPILATYPIVSPSFGSSFSATALLKHLPDLTYRSKKNNQLLDKNNVLRNGCVIAETEYSFFVATFDSNNHILVTELYNKPYAIFECKRVGVEEGQTKGPQTIEKAKQGAYVARTSSALQRIRNEQGASFGIIYKPDGSFEIDHYDTMLQKIVQSDKADLLSQFVLTVGIVSNHGNWFTAENQNKELKVLAQSYDWLLFLSDEGLVTFIQDLLIPEDTAYPHVRSAFLSSYGKEKSKNRFTKSQIAFEADQELTHYFLKNQQKIYSWFNVIAPATKPLTLLKEEVELLREKNWLQIIKT